MNLKGLNRSGSLIVGSLGLYIFLDEGLTLFHGVNGKNGSGLCTFACDLLLKNSAQFRLCLKTCVLK
jgi:hypothetical protein